ncbi:MAG: hypothetical protein QM765_31355 [Myxococcales bacterium]
MDLVYRVLSAMDLPNDAASIFCGQTKPWSKKLEEAYLAAPGRLLVHGVGLITEDLAGLLALLRGERLTDLRDGAGKALANLLGDILEAESATCRPAWDAEAGARDRRRDALAPWLPQLDAVFAALWKDSPSAPTTLIHDCPSLVTREGTHGRSMLWKGRLHLALGLGGPIEQVLCQLIHEATHVATDPPIRAKHAGQRQDTQVASAAFSLHRELERAAVELGDRLVAERAPRLKKAYDLWRRRHGC